MASKTETLLKAFRGGVTLTPAEIEFAMEVDPFTPEEPQKNYHGGKRIYPGTETRTDTSTRTRGHRPPRARMLVGRG